MTYFALFIWLASGEVGTIEFPDQYHCEAMRSVIGGPNVEKSECVEVLRLDGVKQ